MHLFCELHIQLTQQYFSQPSGEFLLDQEPAQVSQRDAQYNAYDQPGDGQRGEGGEVKYHPVQKHYRIVVYQIQGVADISKLYEKAGHGQPQACQKGKD